MASTQGALVLTRKKDEGVTIVTPSGDLIEVAVAEIKRGSVRLMFKASQEYRIKRNELLEEDHSRQLTVSPPEN